MLAPGDEDAKCDKPEWSRWDGMRVKRGGAGSGHSCLNLTSVTTLSGSPDRAAFQRMLLAPSSPVADDILRGRPDTLLCDTRLQVLSGNISCKVDSCLHTLPVWVLTVILTNVMMRIVLIYD